MNNINQAIADLQEGKIILVADDQDRENEVDLICAGVHATQSNIAFMANFGKGLICTPLSQERARALDLPPMVENNTDNHGTAFTVAVDHISTGTGISALDRSVTIIALTDSNAKPDDFCRPGHVFPLVAKPGGVLERPGHTEATVDLMKLAELPLVGVCCEILKEDGISLTVAEAQAFSKLHNLTLISVADIKAAMQK